MNVMDCLPLEQSEDMKQVNPGDYRDENGILHCGACGKPRQKRIRIGEAERIVWCICKCEQDRLQEERRKQEYDEQMRYIERIRLASMMSDEFRDATFENYIRNDYNAKALKIARAYTDKFPEMEKTAQGILFFGPVGTGKSFTSACIANALMDRSIPVIMTSFVKILQDITPQNEGEYTNALNNARLLIIDDLGAERNTPYALEKVYNIIDSRVRANRPMILTTNLKVQDMLQTQEVGYRRIYDRIFKVCYQVGIEGPSFRLMEAARRQEYMKSLFA